MTFVPKYLFIYNLTLTCGWAYVLYKEIYALWSTKFNLVETYSIIEKPLKLVQTAAVLEILHSAFGFVKSRVDITTIQVSSRLFLVWGICNIFPKIISETYGIPMFIIAWSIAEIIRYGYYATHLINCVPYPLVWLRYTLFYVLYPMGVTVSYFIVMMYGMRINLQGEVLAILESFRNAYGTTSFIDLPNSLNIQMRYDFILVLVLVSYFPIFPQLFGHMIVQRKKILGKSHES